MTPTRRWCCAWALPWLLGGCAVDLWVGEPAGAESSEGNHGTSAGSEGGATIAPPGLDTGTSTTADPEPEVTTTTTDGGTTVALEEGTSTTGPVEAGTSTGPVAEGSATTGEQIPCPGLGMLDCNDLAYCLWYGTGEMGECAPSPCENPKHDCWFFGVEACQAAFACAWVADVEPGECAPIECVPCEILTADQCAETPTCTWNEGEVFCFPA